MANDEFVKIKELAERPLKTDKEMKRVELVIMAYNEHDMVANVVGDMIKYANYPFKLIVLDNTSQITPINFSKVWNDRINKTECDFIGFFDSDVFVKQDWLKRMMSAFDDETVDMVLPVLDNTSNHQQKAQGEYPVGSSEVLNSIYGAQMTIYRKSLFDKIGLFDERFLLYGQDSEFGYRFLKHKRKGIIRRDVFVKHIGSYSLSKFAEDNKDLYNASAEREYARRLFKFLQK